MSDNFYIFTECVNCPEIGVNAVISYSKYHKHPVHVYLSKKDLEYFQRNNITSPNIKFVLVSEDLPEVFNKSGHHGTAVIWTNAIFTQKGKNLIHFDADVIFRGNLVDDIMEKMNEGYDLVGPVRCYKHNRNKRDDIRHQPDVTHTFCFGFNTQKIDNYPQNIIWQMVRGFHSPDGMRILDYFDPIGFNILKNGGKIYHIHEDITGGLTQEGGYDNKYIDLNGVVGDVGDKIIHFAGVGSGLNFKKSQENNTEIKVGKSYVHFGLGTLANYRYLLFNKGNMAHWHSKKPRYSQEKIKEMFNDLIDTKFIEF